ncbi:hypothetical protein MIR68_002987 [Amoeboaphelidium protococcarum]|nr:hypothetical protein MIR68_002987 [Amoeboaphelidium protococcarum]
MNDLNKMNRVGDYEILQKIGEGTFGQVFKAKKGDQIFAIKKLILPYEQQQQDAHLRQKLEQEGIPLITYRETKLLKLLNHVNLISLLDTVFIREQQQQAKEADADEQDDQKKSSGKKWERATMFYVFPCMDHDLAGLIENRQVHLTEAVIKCYLVQILRGVRFLHFNSIIHRDLKPANLLLNNEGILKISDFGLARPLDRERSGKYTPNVVTRWYRAPELCMGSTDYNTKIDVWSVGCIFGEMILRRPILMGTTDVDQIWKILQLCGTPQDYGLDAYHGWRELPVVKEFNVPNYPSTLHNTFGHCSRSCIQLMSEFLKLNPIARISADLALDHDYLWQDPLPAEPSLLPKYDSSLEYNTQKAQERRNYQNA